MATRVDSLIAEVMPRCSLRQVDRVAVAADASTAYAIARDVDMYRIPLVRRLFQLRTLPETLVARVRRRPYDANRSSRIDDIARAGTGFLVLREEAGREVVVGSVGKFWQAAIEFADIAPDEFANFDRPGFGKLAWCIRVDPRVGGGSWLTVELRVGATDATSIARFKRYWLLVGRFSHAIRHSVMRMLMRELGAPPEDALRPLPGDEFLESPAFQKTHAVTIEAPVARVWPWLVQMGARRAGWYSFDFLDNGRVPSADHIVPDLQSLSVGDTIPALPSSPEGFSVLRLDAPWLLVLGDPSLLPSGKRSKDAPPWKTSWAFALEPIGGSATRLVVRVRAAYAPSVKMAIVGPVMGVLHEVMERRQLHNLRRRAEATNAT